MQNTVIEESRMRKVYKDSPNSDLNVLFMFRNIHHLKSIADYEIK